MPWSEACYSRRRDEYYTIAKAASAALRNESRLRDKLEKLQQELNTKLRLEADDAAKALRTATELAHLKDERAAQEKAIAKLTSEKEVTNKAMEHLREQLEDAKASVKLAELQYDGLKETIRTLQDENDELKKENRS